MIEREENRRHSQALFYDAITDRRRTEYDRRAQEATVPAVPGTIRPGVRDEWDGVERRSMPEAG